MLDMAKKAHKQILFICGSDPDDATQRGRVDIDTDDKCVIKSVAAWHRERVIKRRTVMQRQNDSVSEREQAPRDPAHPLQ